MITGDPGELRVGTAYPDVWWSTYAAGHWCASSDAGVDSSAGACGTEQGDYSAGSAAYGLAAGTGFADSAGAYSPTPVAAWHAGWYAVTATLEDLWEADAFMFTTGAPTARYYVPTAWEASDRAANTDVVPNVSEGYQADQPLDGRPAYAVGAAWGRFASGGSLGAANDATGQATAPYLGSGGSDTARWATGIDAAGAGFFGRGPQGMWGAAAYWHYSLLTATSANSGWAHWTRDTPEQADIDDGTAYPYQMAVGHPEAVITDEHSYWRTGLFTWMCGVWGRPAPYSILQGQWRAGPAEAERGIAEGFGAALHVLGGKDWCGKSTQAASLAAELYAHILETVGCDEVLETGEPGKLCTNLDFEPNTDCSAADWASWPAGSATEWGAIPRYLTSQIAGGGWDDPAAGQMAYLCVGTHTVTRWPILSKAAYYQCA